MSLVLYYHPLASFCWKPLIALYENQTSFTPKLVDLGDENSRNAFFKLWPIGEFPVLEDSRKNKLIPQSASIIEYLNLHYAGSSKMIPADLELAFETRHWDGFYDAYLHAPMQAIVGACIRPDDKRDPMGADEFHQTIRTSYDILEKRMIGRTWAVGDTFTTADCSAAPALFYADKVEPLGNKYPSLSSYLSRLKLRPSFARVLEEAKPYFHMFPYKPADQKWI
jgi:glutathione S-transferase